MEVRQRPAVATEAGVELIMFGSDDRGSDIRPRGHNDRTSTMTNTTTTCVAAAALPHTKAGPILADPPLRQEAQELLENILLLSQHDMMDEHMVRDTTKCAEALAAERLEVLRLGRGDDAAPAVAVEQPEPPFTMTTALFSDIFAALKKAESDCAVTAAPEVWVAPSSFERQTSKYWVEDHNLAAVLLLASTKAPVLVYGVSGLLTANLMQVSNNAAADLWNHVAVPVSSVYFDSPHLDLYHARIRRQEGSRLLRARWYGTKRPVGDEVIYLELKTHHEAWVTDRSVKERVGIHEKCMLDFLSPVPWTDGVAREIVSTANPDQDECKREKGVRLLLTMKELIIQYNLRPCVRSVYERISFQSANCNALRMTLDRRVTLSDEAPHGDGVSGSTSSPWCVPDDGSFKSGHVFPYSILEIKLAATDNVPQDDFGRTWEGSGLIVDAAKFSKFQTGVVAYNKEKVRILPYWTAHPSFAKFLDPPDNGSGDSRHTSNTSFDTQATSSTKVSSVARDKSTAPVRRALRNIALTSPPCRSSKIAPQSPARIEPKTYFANERTFIQWMSGAFLLVTVATILFDIGAVNDAGDGYNNDTNAASTRGISIGLLCFAATITGYAVFTYYRRLQLLASRQPQGYNERHGPVLLALALLVGIVMLLLYFSDVFAPAAAAGSIYERPRPVLRPDNVFCTQHHLQGINLLQYQPSDALPLADRPGVLLVPSLSQITSVSVVKGDNNDSETAMVDVVADLGEADIEALAQWHDRILAVSEGGDKKSTLLEFRWKNASTTTTTTSDGAVSSSSRTLELVSSIKISSPFVEGLAVVDRDLYVAGNVLDERTGLTMGTVDVYTDLFGPDIMDAANNSTNNSSSIHNSTSATTTTTTEATSTTTTTVRSGHRLNSKLLGQGLLDSKIGSLYYFEGVLYILYDNAQLVRGWRLATSEQVVEWLLPVTPKSSSSAVSTGGGGGGIQQQQQQQAFPSSSSSSFDFDKQWEGLALERYPDDNNRLVLHLTLDSPPEVWTLQLSEKTRYGTAAVGSGAAAQDYYHYPTLPGCAS